LAAFVKLCSSATVRNTDSALRSFASICEFYSQRACSFMDLLNSPVSFYLGIRGHNEQRAEPHCSFPLSAPVLPMLCDRVMRPYSIEFSVTSSELATTMARA
jgi:hypothetical protein